MTVTKLRSNKRIIEKEEEKFYVPDSPIYIPPKDFIDLTSDTEDCIDLTVKFIEEPVKKVSWPINAAPVVEAITVATLVDRSPSCGRYRRLWSPSGRR